VHRLVQDTGLFLIHHAPLPKLGTGKIDKIELRDRYRRELAASA
jgi:hypothetical protein